MAIAILTLIVNIMDILSLLNGGWHDAADMVAAINTNRRDCVSNVGNGKQG